MCDRKIVGRVHADDALELRQLDAVVLPGLKKLLRHTILRSGKVEHLNVILATAKKAIQIVRVWNRHSMLRARYLTPGTGWPPWACSARATGALTLGGRGTIEGYVG